MSKFLFERKNEDFGRFEKKIEEIEEVEVSTTTNKMEFVDWKWKINFLKWIFVIKYLFFIK